MRDTVCRCQCAAYIGSPQSRTPALAAVAPCRRRATAGYLHNFTGRTTAPWGRVVLFCPRRAGYPEVWSDHHHANSLRTAPSLCADMIFGKDRENTRPVLLELCLRLLQGSHAVSPESWDR